MSSSTLGQPGFVPSNTTGTSGVSQGMVGRLGTGVLQTIEEGAAAQIGDIFYYDKSVAYYQLPSVQRSHGDDPKTVNITSFGSRGTVTLPRRFFNFGPAAVRFRLPIDYAWSGCEYVLNTYDSGTPLEFVSAAGFKQANNADIDFTGGIRVFRPEAMAASANGGKMMFESSGCDTMLPTSFSSGGMAFAFPSQIELNMGGGGTITFDRYSNWAAIMASCPFQKLRADLMRMAGGGLNLSDPQEAKTAPVRWGYKPWMCAAGYTNVTIPHLFATANADTYTVLNQTLSKKKFVPIEWDVLLPIKTPETNFMYSLERRKPLDASCFSGDVQITFNWANFNEYTDTGKGYPNAPSYFATRSAGPDTFKDGGAGGHRGPFTGLVPAAYKVANPADKTFCGYGGELGCPILQNILGLADPVYMNDDNASITAADVKKVYGELASIVAAKPVVWTNHYRVASGQKMVVGVHTEAGGTNYSYNKDDAGDLGIANTGRCRFPQLLVFDNDTAGYKSLQQCADFVNDKVSYPSKFTSVEYINSTLKLTNQAIGAYNALRVDKEAVLYYPFQYFYSQIYRVTTNKFANLTQWNGTTVADSSLADIYSESNKITQLIQMPANPCTSLLVSIFREKDRKVLQQGKLNSYSPALFWLALNPEKMELKDGGTTMFSYRNNVDFEYYSLMDRPDALKVPFRGGHVKVMPKNLYGNRHISGDITGCGGSYLPSTVALATEDFNAQNPAIAAVRNFARMKPYWFIGTANNKPAIGVGYQGINSIDASKNSPETSVNNFPADELCNLVALRGLGGQVHPCHTTDVYESTIMEFPFVMNEPITNEKMVQQTPSFAKTQLQLDFWISPVLKPDNGLDDMYDVTYGVTRGNPSGTCSQRGDQSTLQRRGYIYPGPISHPVPDCYHEGGCNPTDGELIFRNRIGAETAQGEVVPTTAGRGLNQVFDTASVSASKYADAYQFSQSNSWNINNGDLMLHIVYCQNQVWTVSPLRTSLLQARG